MFSLKLRYPSLEGVFYPGSSTEADIKSATADLRKKAPEWASMSLSLKAKLCRECIKATISSAPQLMDLEVKVRGLYNESQERYLLLQIPAVRYMREVAEYLESGATLKPESIRRLPNGQLVARVNSRGLVGNIEEQDVDLYIMPGKEATQGSCFQNGVHTGDPGVQLILGGGNQTFLPIVDTLYSLVHKNQVVCLKLNPVNAYISPYISKALAPLIARGFVRILHGGVSISQALTTHPTISSIHMTGSEATYNAIVWQGKKDNGSPQLSIPVYGELGNITPAIIVPGQWSVAELQWAAKIIINGKLDNSGHNCLAFEVIVTQKGWRQSEQFLELLQAEAAKLPQRVHWYPGSDERYNAFKQRFPDAVQLGASGTDSRASPLLFAMHVAPSDARLRQETWSMCLQHIEVNGDDVESYLKAATNFVNNECWGNLAASVFMPPKVLEVSRDAVEACVLELRYGTIAVNTTPGRAYFSTPGVWGGFPGNTPEDIQSGNILVLNSLFFDYPQKQVNWFKLENPKTDVGSAAFQLTNFYAWPSLWTLISFFARLIVYLVIGF